MTDPCGYTMRFSLKSNNEKQCRIARSMTSRPQLKPFRNEASTFNGTTTCIQVEKFTSFSPPPPCAVPEESRNDTAPEKDVFYSWMSIGSVVKRIEPMSRRGLRLERGDGNIQGEDVAPVPSIAPRVGETRSVVQPNPDPWIHGQGIVFGFNKIRKFNSRSVDEPNKRCGKKIPPLGSFVLGLQNAAVSQRNGAWTTKLKDACETGREPVMGTSIAESSAHGRGRSRRRENRNTATCDVSPERAFAVMTWGECVPCQVATWDKRKRFTPAAETIGAVSKLTQFGTRKRKRGKASEIER
ncbi:hypothetical protein C8R45DRAFT_938690 [Mycena sanguinolenta]|nr:hypothetical protein C8R45DRAFT_938690 [Mycena sanguinolenta]